MEKMRSGMEGARTCSDLGSMRRPLESTESLCRVQVEKEHALADISR